MSLQTQTQLSAHTALHRIYMLGGEECLIAIKESVYLEDVTMCIHLILKPYNRKKTHRIKRRNENSNSNNCKTQYWTFNN